MALGAAHRGPTRLLLIALQDRYAGILEAIDELSAAETADEVRCAALRMVPPASFAWRGQRTPLASLTC